MMEAAMLVCHIYECVFTFPVRRRKKCARKAEGMTDLGDESVARSEVSYRVTSDRLAIIQVK
jgi:hypothetical protein